MAAPTSLRVEHLDVAFGLTISRPRLSWQLPTGARVQTAYRIQAGDWDSGPVRSSRSVLVPYGGPDVPSAMRVEWRVKLWTDAGESDWSAWAWWETGLLQAADWIAQWIQPPESEAETAEPLHSGHLLRGSFACDSAVERARLYATAHGIYELHLNGRRVGDLELTPGFTSYGTNLEVQTFDVTDLVERGSNTLEATLTDGWFRGQAGPFRTTKFYGERVSFLAQLELRDPNGAVTRFGTGPDWRATRSAIVSADLFTGQAVDRTRADGAELPAEVCDFTQANLSGPIAPPVRRIEELRPIAISRLAGGRQIVDFGQNINGWTRLERLGARGTTIALTHGEALDAGGDVTIDHLVSNHQNIDQDDFPWSVANWFIPFQEDRITAGESPNESFEPRHTTHGFRYVRVDGPVGDLGANDVSGVVVHTDLRRTGWFECSEPRLNALHETVVWSLRGNACEIPTDCPTRERAGWTGDWLIFVDTAALIYDVAGFSARWLRDLAADQRPDGCVPHWIPDTLPQVEDSAIPPGSAGCGDAAVFVPWEIHRAYGDVGLLETQWPSMAAWVDYAARAAATSGDPYLWESGFHWGEWLEPGAPVTLPRGDQSDVATAYLHRSTHLLAAIAQLLGRAADEERYRELAGRTKAAWQRAFVTPAGTLTRDTQASYVRALAFDLLPAELRATAAGRLVELVREADTHLGTGFLATPYLLPALADTGHIGIAYELLLRDTEPSWLTMIDRGATTTWELWNGLDEHGVPEASLNHYSKGAVVSFLYRHTAGISLIDAEPGYRRFRVAPKPGGGLTSATAVHESPYGRIESSWELRHGRFVLKVTVPPGAVAELELPDGSRSEQPSGRHVHECRAP
jgi:alpha-L-rhamnosidase